MEPHSVPRDARTRLHDHIHRLRFIPRIIVGLERCLRHTQNVYRMLKPLYSLSNTQSTWTGRLLLCGSYADTSGPAARFRATPSPQLVKYKATHASMTYMPCGTAAGITDLPAWDSQTHFGSFRLQPFILLDGIGHISIRTEVNRNEQLSLRPK